MFGHHLCNETPIENGLEMRTNIKMHRVNRGIGKLLYKHIAGSFNIPAEAMIN